MDWKAKAINLLTKITENKYLNKVEGKIVSALNKIDKQDPVKPEEGAKPVVETV